MGGAARQPAAPDRRADRRPATPVEVEACSPDGRARARRSRCWRCALSRRSCAPASSPKRRPAPTRSRWRSRWHGIGSRKHCATSRASRPADLDDYALEWQARAALWAGDWKPVANTIAVMSDTQRGARALALLGRTRGRAQTTTPKLARQLYESVLTDDNYYSVMRRGAPRSNPSHRIRRAGLDEVQLKQIEQLPALVRARELLPSEHARSREARMGVRLRDSAETARPQAFIWPRAGAGMTRPSPRRPAAHLQRLRAALSAALRREVRAAAQVRVCRRNSSTA